MIFTITGPSGSGKTTLVKELVRQFPGRYARIVSTTTREPRQGEVDGRDYHFISREQFELERRKGMFIESTEFGGNLYGIRYKDIIGAGISDNLHVVGVLERNGALALQKYFGPMARRVYISIEERKALRRLARRDGWSKARKRVKTDKENSLFDPSGFDCVLKNDQSKKELAKNFDNYVIAMEYSFSCRDAEVSA